MDKIFKSLVDQVGYYLVKNNLKAMVLGISGGIDSTIVSAICSEVEKNTGIPFYGFSLPIKNKNDEFSTSDLVGKAFCKEDRFDVVNFLEVYNFCSHGFNEAKNNLGIGKTLISEGNIQARLRMMFLYDVASNLGGIVFSTDNQTEYNLGFWTLHGDVGDINPMFGLWKTEVYKLAEYLVEYYKDSENKREALKQSIGLTPTDGLGISNSDLEQIGARSYDEVDDILKKVLRWKSAYRDHLPENKDEFIEFFLKSHPELDQEVAKKVVMRHLCSEFKRGTLPVQVIPSYWKDPVNYFFPK